MVDVNMKKEKPKYSTWANILYLLKNIWKWDKPLFLLSAIQIPAIVIIPLLGIYLPKVLIDSIVEGVSISQLMINIGIPILAIIILKIILEASSSATVAKKIYHRMKYVRLLMYKQMDTDFENIDGAEGQDKVMKANMATNQNSAATEAVTNISVEFFSNILGFILYSGIIFTIHPVIVGFIILSTIINYFMGKYVNNYEYKNKDNLSPIERKLRYIRNKTGDFKSAKDIRLYNMSSWFQGMYRKLLKERIYFQKKNVYRRYFSNIIDGILLLIRDGMTYGFLIYSVLYRDMPVGDFVLYFGAVAGLSTWLSGIVKNINELNAIALDTNDLREFLEMEDNMNRDKGIALPKSYELPCDIELKNLYYKYPGAEDYTIKDINFHIKKGEKLALVGPNGAGKTTLVKLICGLYTPTKGEIYINGKKSSLYNRDEYYSLFSIVFQDTYLLPVSIEKNIALQLEEEIDDEKMDSVLNMSGLMPKIRSLPNGKKTLLVKSVYSEAIELSGGETQKLMLARALYRDGPIIILDEPTAALDPIAENEIYQRYNELTQDHTSIFISHRLSSTRFCDRIVFMEDGRIVEEGDHYTLMEKGGKYREIYDMQSHYYKDDIGGEKYAEK
ncbi:ABC transporter ATP-binding protein [Clostridium sp. Cult3]|uniref:ABC transporter ATP-binding protein n=1 Tax=Clostridium sp. Cult3 TaxID=2079004 RepID=UPI001F258C3A|nr:ABC transporter ATP-binding protein [Clostridium sp. Cult3]MCF6460192.1 ABC transporter ATP-binding protein [Clostridium sp. Cult3]